ncbi:ankyrin repeat, PH and SEC7 domain containing protein secG-like [Bolinopsis microptera]|uniref:ankyrin repeat, PH and SEC7 domain containing protein secG-like n=1 Tax=Bolinopsis microptera TaxID=2820187 RepID=UPI003078B05C
MAAVDAFSRNPLQIACLNNNVNVVKYLTDRVKELLPFLDMEKFVNYSTGEHGETALHCGARGGSKEVIDILIKAGAKTDCVSASQRTPLHVACKRGNLDAATALANWNGELITSVDDSGKTALMIASAENDSPAIAQMLIGLGAKISVHDHTGKTPVFEAVLHNRVNVLEYLMTQLTSDMIEQDIDKSQNTPLHWAADKGFLICCKDLAVKWSINNENARGVTPLHLAAEAGHRTTVKVLLEAGAKFNVPDLNEETPLHYSARAGQEDTTKALINKGANLAKVSQFGDTPLLTAIRNNNENVIALLLQSEQWNKKL